MKLRSRAVIGCIIIGSFTLVGVCYFRNLSTVSQTTVMERMVDQAFIVGIPGPTLDSYSRNYLRRMLPGGVILYRRNFYNLEQATRLIADLQKFALATTGQRYLILVDEEPNGASRLDLLKDVDPDRSWREIDSDVYQLGRTGINVELAPVSDYPFNKNTFIADRIPVKSVQKLIDFNALFIQLLHDHGVLATLKHFPGLGVFTDDPHNGQIGEYVPEDYWKSSLQIFQSGIDNGADAIMTNHATYKNIDPDNPATFSHKIITDLLRKKMGFTGLIITDDLSEMPIGYQPSQLGVAAVRALRAGHTMLTFSHSHGETVGYAHDVAVAAAADSSLAQIIRDNYSHIIAAKSRMKTLN